MCLSGVLQFRWWIDGDGDDAGGGAPLSWDRLAAELFHGFQDRALAALADQ